MARRRSLGNKLHGTATDLVTPDDAAHQPDGTPNMTHTKTHRTLTKKKKTIYNYNLSITLFLLCL